MLLEHHQRHSPQRSEVRRRMPFRYPALVFAEMDIHLPMQVVLDRPMTSQCLRIYLGSRWGAADKITDLRARLFTDRPFTHAHANYTQTVPPIGLSQARRGGQGGVAAALNATLPALLSRVLVMLHADE